MEEVSVSNASIPSLNSLDLGEGRMIRGRMAKLSWSVNHRMLLGSWPLTFGFLAHTIVLTVHDMNAMP